VCWPGGSGERCGGKAGGPGHRLPGGRPGAGGHGGRSAGGSGCDDEHECDGGGEGEAHRPVRPPEGVVVCREKEGGPRGSTDTDSPFLRRF